MSPQEQLNHWRSEALARQSEDAPDPIFAALERFKPHADAHRAVMALPDEDRFEGAKNASQHATLKALGDVYRTTPTTPAGLIALMAAILEWDGDVLEITDQHEQDDPNMDDAQRVLCAVFRHAAKMAGV